MTADTRTHEVKPDYYEMEREDVHTVLTLGEAQLLNLGRESVLLKDVVSLRSIMHQWMATPPGVIQAVQLDSVI